MTNEERQRLMDFILERQAKFSTEIERLQESHASAEKRMGALEKGFVSLYNFIAETAKLQRENSEQLVIMQQNIANLAISQKDTDEQLKHTDERLSALIVVLEDDINSRKNGRAKKQSSSKSRATSKKRKT